MDVGDFFYAPKEPSYIIMGEDGRAHYGRRQRVVELLVPMCCIKCEEKVRENMFELEGVQDVMVNPTTQRVTVSGFVDPMRTLKKARKVKWDSQLLSGDHLIPSSSKRHHRNEYRRWSSAYQAPPVSSSSFVYQPASAYHTSYNLHTPASGYQTSYDLHSPASTAYQTSYDLHTPASYGHAARPSYYEMVITNPCYVKDIEHDGFWY